MSDEHRALGRLDQGIRARDRYCQALHEPGQMHKAERISLSQGFLKSEADHARLVRLLAWREHIHEGKCQSKHTVDRLIRSQGVPFGPSHFHLGNGIALPKTKLYDATLLFIHFREFGQGSVQGDQVDVRRHGQIEGLV